MASEISIPFGVDASGRIATTPDPSERARHHLLAYLVTSPGERVMRPTWGTSLKAKVFSSFGVVENALVTKSAADAVARDLHDVRLRQLSIGDISEEGSAPVQIEFALVMGDGTSTTNETAVIEVGSR